MRIALLCPYSWTYPGGVTRHVEALAAELRHAGHDVRVLAPYDPDDAIARRTHRGARPQERDLDEHFVSLGRTVGLRANGAVSNLSLNPAGVLRMREELGSGRYELLHIHEPVVPLLSWDALCSLGELPLVGTFHTYSENVLTNGIAAVPLGGSRRMNRLRARIAVSGAAAWTARRFHGGRYRIIPNGVHLPDATEPAPRAEGEPLRILFIGQAVQRKGLPVLLAAFEALRDHVPAALTLVGCGRDEVAPLMLDDRGVEALGKVSEQRKLDELRRAHVLCAPSLGGESFGMVLTEGLAAATPVVASDIAGYRDVVRDGLDGMLVAPEDPVALASALRAVALDEPRRRRMAASARERAERFAWPAVAAEVLDTYEHALRIPSPAGRVMRGAVRLGLAPADREPRVPRERLPSLERARPACASAGIKGRIAKLRRPALLASTSAAAALGCLALERVGLTRVAASFVASRPILIAAALALMCAAMLARAIAWQRILAAAPTWRRARRRDAMQGTFIGVLMSATLPARLGEPSRAVIVAHRIGRARETLPVVLATMVSQTILNLLALALLAGATVTGLDPDPVGRHHGVLILVSLAPLLALACALLVGLMVEPGSKSRTARLRALERSAGRLSGRLREGLAMLARPRTALSATAIQLSAWALQLAACWLLLVAFGLGPHTSVAAAAAVLFAVNVTNAVPLTPANVGIFQAACAIVLVGAYHVSTPAAIAFGISLQAIELATALLMGLPALLNEGLSWREVRLRALHASPVELGPLPAPGLRRPSRAA